MDHGKQPLDIIIREKQMSSFHLYVTNSFSEIDCISIRESLATGAIPLISNFGVFKERDGIHFDIINYQQNQNQQLQNQQLQNQQLQNQQNQQLQNQQNQNQQLQNQQNQQLQNQQLQNQQQSYQSYQNLGLEIIKLIHDKYKNLDEYREELKKSKLLISWEDIAIQWLN